MPRLHLMHPDPILGRFLADYLDLKGFPTTFAENNVESFTIIHKDPPDLILMNKESAYLDIDGFFIKKRNAGKVDDMPIFVFGDFSPKEIQNYKANHVKAFLSRKINPLALVERLNIYFGKTQQAPDRKTPMLLDIHAKDSTLVIQIEGNLEMDKLLILNFRIRLFLKEHKTVTPRIMFIIPHLYPDEINPVSIAQMFQFFEFKELKVDPKKIVILSTHKLFLSTVGKNLKLAAIRKVDNYYEGFRSISADFDMETKVPVYFMKVGNHYWLDLYDQYDRVRLPAQRPVTAELIEALEKEGLKHLKYYGKDKSDTVNSVIVPDSALHESDVDLEDLDSLQAVTDDATADVFDMNSVTMMDFITREFKPVSTELFEETVFNEKQNLFFSANRGQSLLFVSLNKGLFELVQQSLSTYFTIDNVAAGINLRPLLDEKRYSIIFIDLDIPFETVAKILFLIRSHSTRRKTTIILMAKTINKSDLLNFKKYGTDHVILQPYTTEKFFAKIYQAVTADREQ